MNATPARPAPSPTADAAERRTRHLTVCQELIALGMTLARAAAEHALQDMAAPPPTQTIPTSAAACVADAEARLRHHAPDYGLTFARIARTVRQTVALEAHIAEGRARAAAPADPRRVRLAAALHAATATHPDRAELRRDAAERLDWALDADPDAATPIDDMLQAISQDLGIAAPQPVAPQPVAHKPVAHQPSPTSLSPTSLSPTSLSPTSPPAAPRIVLPPAHPHPAADTPKAWRPPIPRKHRH